MLQEFKVLFSIPRLLSWINCWTLEYFITNCFGIIAQLLEVLCFITNYKIFVFNYTCRMAWSRFSKSSRPPIHFDIKTKHLKFNVDKNVQLTSILMYAGKYLYVHIYDFSCNNNVYGYSYCYCYGKVIVNVMVMVKLWLWL